MDVEREAKLIDTLVHKAPWEYQFRKNWYAAVWRWHFYAGIFVAPFLLLMAVSGALYVFHDEIVSIANPELTNVRVVGGRLPLSAQIVAAEKANSGFRAASVLIMGSNSATEVLLQPRGAVAAANHHPAHSKRDGGKMHRRREMRDAFVDPFTGKYLGSSNDSPAEKFFAAVLTLHKTLFLGVVGRVLTELAASWLLILVVSGFYLWLPRDFSKIRGVWLPRLRSGKRALIRDLHVVPAIYLALGIAAMAFTGLFFTQVWSTAFVKIAHVPQITRDMPESNIIAGQAPIGIDAVMQRAAESGFRPQLFINLPEGETGSWRVNCMERQWPFRTGSFVMDQYSGKILQLRAPAQSSWLANLHWIAYEIHTGEIFGVATKIIVLLIALGVVALIVTGVWMWWYRRPEGATGFPKHGRSPLAIVLIAIPLGIFLPLAGVSMLIVTLGQLLLSLILRRFARHRAEISR